MLTRRALVGKLAASAAVAVAWAAGGARPSAAALRVPAHPQTGSGGEGRRAPERAPTAVQPPAPDSIAAPAPARPLVPESRASGALAPPSAPPPWELLRPLRMGAVAACGWRVAGLSEVVDGVCVLTLRNARGRAHRVHLCRNAGRPQGLVYTKRLDLVVMNGGRGDLPTDEGFAQAVAVVAHVLAANERRRQHAPVMAGLLPHTERLRLYAAAGDGRLR